VTAKLVASIVTFLASTATGIVVLFMLLLALNGFSESDGIYGIALYFVIALLTIILTSVACWFMVSKLQERMFNAIVSVTVPTIGFTLIAVLVEVFAMFIGVMVASIVQKNF